MNGERIGWFDDRTIATGTGRTVACPRAMARVATKLEGGFSLQTYILDTGADVTLVPLEVARRTAFAGYDPGATLVTHSTSFGGSLEGRWGTLTVRFGEREPALPCFFYGPPTGKGWFGAWVGRFARQAAQRPLVLGRAGLYDRGFRLTLAHPFIYLK